MITTSQPELSSPFAGKEWNVMASPMKGGKGKRVWGHVSPENWKKN